jgi:hypothetical protein
MVHKLKFTEFVHADTGSSCGQSLASEIFDQ